ncbi:MAG: YlbF family regulator [Atribacterota bacterium]
MNTVLSQALKDAIRSLVEQIISTQPFQDFENTRIMLSRDAKALQLLERLEEEQKSLSRIALQRDLVDEDFAGIEQARQEALSHPVILAYFQAQDRLVSLLQEINNEMSNLLGFDFASSAAQSERELEEGWE